MNIERKNIFFLLFPPLIRHIIMCGIFIPPQFSTDLSLAQFSFLFLSTEHWRENFRPRLCFQLLLSLSLFLLLVIVMEEQEKNETMVKDITLSSPFKFLHQFCHLMCPQVSLCTLDGKTNFYHFSREQETSFQKKSEKKITFHKI